MFGLKFISIFPVDEFSCILPSVFEIEATPPAPVGTLMVCGPVPPGIQVAAPVQVRLVTGMGVLITTAPRLLQVV